MDYYLNEYSLRGQFESVDDFFSSIRIKTIPVLNKIEEGKGNVIWKKDTFWKSEICKGITLFKIPKRKNERTEEKVCLLQKLIKLASEDPFWENNLGTDLKVEEYKFDEEYRECFAEVNCFTKAIEKEGRIISFVHPSYQNSQLPVLIKYAEEKVEYNIDNIIDETWWKSEPEIKSWNISGKYSIEVRANEFEYHPPHFHASYNEYEAVFKLNDGELYRDGKKKWTSQMISEVKIWYQEHKDELQEAWENLHSK